MFTLFIDGSRFIIKPEISILEACQYIGLNVPRFCFHEMLSPAANCRMCLVGIEEEEDKEDEMTPVTSCATEAEFEMDLAFDNPIIRKIREEVIEFFLINHPLDCPICDQGGECDLQDQAFEFGLPYNKFLLNKKVVEDKNFNSFIKTIMTRCIHCTRCVRFSSEIIGIDFLGTLSRGNNMEIGTFMPATLSSNMSTHLVDLCPVGALTSKYFSFQTRPWESYLIDSIDLTDGVGSNVYIRGQESEICRIIPKIHSDINGGFLSDRARHYFDFLISKQVLQYPFEVYNFNQIYTSNSVNFVKKLKDLISNEKVLVLTSNDLSFENVLFLKQLSILNKNLTFRSIENFNIKRSNLFINFDKRISKITEDDNGLCYFFSFNPSTEAAVLNARLRVLTNTNYYAIYNFGFYFDTILEDSFFINSNSKEIIKIAEGKAIELSEESFWFENSFAIFGSNFSNRGLNSTNFESYIKKRAVDLDFLNIYSQSNSLNFLYSNIKFINYSDFAEAKIIMLLNCRESLFLKKNFFQENSKTFFWLNTHKLDFPLETIIQIPMINSFEEKGTYINLEFRPQISEQFNFKKSQGKFDFISFFSKLYIYNLKKKTRSTEFIKKLANKSALLFTDYFIYYATDFLESFLSVHANNFDKITNYPFKSSFNDLFKVNNLTDFSKSMQEASQEQQKITTNFLKMTYLKKNN